MTPEGDCIDGAPRERFEVNSTIPFDASMLQMCMALRSLEVVSKELSTRGEVSGFNEIVWALKTMTLIDTTTLCSTDTLANVRKVCVLAANPLPMKYVYKKIDKEIQNHMHTYGVCVYPARVDDVYTTMERLDLLETLNIVAVTSGFPSAQYCLQTRLREITFSMLAGANEIEAVINRQLVLVGNWEGLYNEVAAMRHACSYRARLKVILVVGELATMENIYKASMTCMMGGADFIVTSTGKETVNATLPAGLTMIYAIREFQRRTCQLVGLKVAGGFCTIRDVIPWIALVKETLGQHWLVPSLLRFAAPNLLENIISFLVTGNRIAGEGPPPARKPRRKPKVDKK